MVCQQVVILLLEEQFWDGVGALARPDDVLFELACAAGMCEFEASVLRRHCRYAKQCTERWAVFEACWV
jgi:hypothetical protein